MLNLAMASAEKRSASEMELVPAKKQKTGILAVSGTAGQVAGYVRALPSRYLTRLYID